MTAGRLLERVRCWPGWWHYLAGLALHGQWRQLWLETAPGWWLDRRHKS